MKKSEKDRLEILFQDKDCKWYGPILIKSPEDIEHLKYEHRNYYYKYLIRETKNNTQSVIDIGYLEPDPVKKKVRKK